jgi:hypothetical protein
VVCDISAHNQSVEAASLPKQASREACKRSPQHFVLSKPVGSWHEMSFMVVEDRTVGGACEMKI